MTLEGPWWRRLVPGGIAARIALTLLLALLLTQAVSALVYLTDRGHDRPMYSPGELAQRMVSLVQLLDATPAADRPRVERALNDPLLGIEWRTSRPTFDSEFLAPPGSPLLVRLADELGGAPREIIAERRRVPVVSPATGPLQPDDMYRVRMLRVGVGLSDGSWLVFSSTHAPDGSFRLGRFALWMGLIALVVTGLSLWAARRLAAPLAAFAAAAERLSVDGGGPPLPETGPSELRAATAAVNRMQERLTRFIEDRTRLVAAIGHDLRTPLTRLRLRAEFIDDAETQRKILADLAEMEAMISATLAFARDDAQHEPRVQADLAELLQSLVDDRLDADAAAGYQGPGHLAVTCSPIALRRAFANLIDNAIHYGERADVTLTAGAGHAVIEIDDIGPGIPEPEREKVFQPFYRLENSRCRDTGGTGLGLSVARTIVRGHGGDIGLTDRQGGGLKVTVTLPL